MPNSKYIFLLQIVPPGDNDWFPVSCDERHWEADWLHQAGHHLPRQWGSRESGQLHLPSLSCWGLLTTKYWTPIWSSITCNHIYLPYLWACKWILFHITHGYWLYYWYIFLKNGRHFHVLCTLNLLYLLYWNPMYI